MRWTRTKYHGRTAYKSGDWIVAAPSRGSRTYSIYRGGDRAGGARGWEAAKAEVSRRDRPSRVKPRKATVKADACARQGRQPRRERDRMPNKAFALPALRSYPLYRMHGGKLVPSGTHAANAKARANQQLKKGNFTTSQYATVVRKADAVLAKCAGRGGKRPGNPRSKHTKSEREQRSILNASIRDHARARR